MERLEVIRTYYESKMGKGLPDYGVLGWESQKAQDLRFDILLSSVDLNGKKLLDVGCGMGNLYQYMKDKGIDASYTGVDILKSMIEQARVKNPGIEFHYADIFKNNIFEEGSFDVSYASGIFNIDLGNNREFLVRAVDILLGLSTEAVVFNLLHVDSPGREAGYSYFHPDEIKDMVGHLKHKVRRLNIVEAYLKNDFTVVLNK